MGCITFNNANPGGGCSVSTGYPIGAIISEDPFQFTEAELLDGDDAIKARIIAEAGRLIPIVEPEWFEVISQREQVAITTTNNINKQVSVTGFSFKISKDSPDWYQIQKSLIDGAGQASCYLILITSTGFFEGNVDSDGNINSRKFQVSKNLMEAEGQDTLRKLDYNFAEIEPLINIAAMWYGKPNTYSPTDLLGIKDVTLVVDSSIATTIVCTVTKNGFASNLPTTLTVDNFVALNVGGVAQTISDVQYSNGQYTLTGLALETGTLQVVPTVDDPVLYESELIDFTVA